MKRKWREEGEKVNVGMSIAVLLKQNDVRYQISWIENRVELCSRLILRREHKRGAVA